jgi:hypothetical protein
MANISGGLPIDILNVVDNSGFVEPVITSPSGPVGFFPLIAPHGYKKDFELIEIDAYDTATLAKFGTPNFDKWGSSMYVAEQYIKGGGRAIVMRCTSPESAHAHVHLVAKTKVRTNVQATNAAGAPLYLTAGGQTTTDATGSTPIVRNVLNVKFELQSSVVTNGDFATPLSALLNATPDTDGRKTFPIMSWFVRGKGKFGNGYSQRILNDIDLDAVQDGRHYKMEILENGATITLPITFSLNGNEIYQGESVYVEQVMNKYSEEIMGAEVSEVGLELFLAEVAATVKDETISELDIFFGKKKDATASYQYEIDPTSVSFTTALGYNFAGGSDGNLDISKPSADRKILMDSLLIKAFSGEYNEMIFDPIRYSIRHVFGCGYSAEVSDSIALFVAKRQLTTIGFLDIGIVSTFSAALSVRQSSIKVSQPNIYIDSQNAQISDSYTGKNITMPAGYFNAFVIPAHIQAFGSQTPFAGDRVRWKGYNKDTLVPQTANIELQSQLHDNRLNFCIETGAQTANKYEQILSSTKTSDLSELNNAHVLAEMIEVALNFSNARRWTDLEDGDIASFKKDLDITLKDMFNNKFSKLEITTTRLALNGVGKYRVKCDLNVWFKKMFKGANFTFYING